MAVEDIVAAAVEYGMPAAGLVDRDTLAGAVQFYKQAKGAGIHPVIGSEVTLEGGGTLVLLVENTEGYRNLCRLLTTRIEHPGGVTLDDLNRFRAGLICLCGTVRSECRDVFGKNFALEIALGDRALAVQGRRSRIPLVATARAHYRAPQDRLFYDILASMRTLTLLTETHADKRGAGDYHSHSPEEMARHFRDLPQALENTQRMAEHCQFDFELGDILLPPFPTPSRRKRCAPLE